MPWIRGDLLHLPGPVLGGEQLAQAGLIIGRRERRRAQFRLRAGPNPARRINLAVAVRQPEYTDVGAQSVDDADCAVSFPPDRQPLAPRFAFAESEIDGHASRDPSRIQMLVV